MSSNFEFVDCKTIDRRWAALCVPCAGLLAASASPSLCRVFQLCDDGWVCLL